MRYEIRKWYTSPNSGMCSCTFVAPHPLELKWTGDGRPYLEVVTETEFSWAPLWEVEGESRD